MSHTTLSRKTVVCPMWDEEITLCGKYLISEEKGHEYEAHFLYATCPVIENLRLPRAKKDPKYECFPFCHHQPCELLEDFKPVLDLRKGYSQ